MNSIPGLRWWDHQRAWLDDSARFRICLKARQCGMSTVVAAEAVVAETLTPMVPSA